MHASVLEIPNSKWQPDVVTLAESQAAMPDVPIANFTAAEMNSFQNDDAMAAGVIAVVLGLAFVVLLTLTIGVSVWTVTVAG
jgi:hypothetical protein